MTVRSVKDVWSGQCRSARDIKKRFGERAAFDFLVTEKLLSFADVADLDPNFARELPRFISEVRQIFDSDELCRNLARIERAQRRRKVVADPGDGGGPIMESLTEVRTRLSRFQVLRDMLTAPQLGTS